MGPSRVKIAKDGGIPVVVSLSFLLQLVALRLDMIGDDRFNGGFGATIGICGTNRAMFWNGDHVGKASCIAIDGSGGGEDNVGNVVLGHGAEKTDSAVDIGAIIFERNLARLADCLG